MWRHYYNSARCQFPKYFFSLSKKLPFHPLQSLQNPQNSILKIGVRPPPSLSNFLSMADENSPLIVRDLTSATKSLSHRKLFIAKRKASVVLRKSLPQFCRSVQFLLSAKRKSIIVSMGLFGCRNWP